VTGALAQLGITNSTLAHSRLPELCPRSGIMTML
jgi:hypothetical protein